MIFFIFEKKPLLLECIFFKILYLNKYIHNFMSKIFKTFYHEGFLKSQHHFNYSKKT